MKALIVLTMALAVGIALTHERRATAHDGPASPRKNAASVFGEHPRLDSQAIQSAMGKEAADALAKIRNRSRGNVLLVECHGAFGYDTVQGAIDAAEDGDIVVVLPRNAFGFECDGDAYVENINFLGKAITVQSLIPENPAHVAATIIDGSLNGSVVTFETGENQDSVLDGLTVTNGSADLGGGIVCGYSSPTISNCRILGNTDGGGLWCWGGAPLISMCTISDNTCIPGPGGIGCVGSLTINHCTISGNMSYCSASGIACSGNLAISHCTITDNVGCSLGGVFCNMADGVISNCTISDNIAISGDGSPGIYCQDSSLTIEDCAISGNTSRGIICERGDVIITDCMILSNEGGGVSCYEASPEIRNCTISNNTSSDNGGGIYCRESSPVVSNCTITGNTAPLGGGIYSIDCPLTLRNSVVSYNITPYSQSQGGGIYCRYESLTMFNCTLTGNIAQGQGGGVWADGCALAIHNSILWGDSADNGPEVWISYAPISVEYCNVEGSEAGIHAHGQSTFDWGCGNINLDPGFIDEDYHIGRDSLARNAGDPDYVPEPGETDIDGDSRIQEGRIDMGADEFVLHRRKLSTIRSCVSYHGDLKRQSVQPATHQSAK